MADVLVLCYHAVSDDWPDELAVRPRDLERQLEHLLGHGYTATTFTDAISAPPARRTLAVTFDDGYRNVVELGLPVLERLGAPGTLFVPTAQIATGAPMAWPGIDRWLGTPHAPELTGVSWEQVATLAEAGWEIGSHTRTHPHLPELDDQRLDDELGASRAEIERRLGGACRSLAYPYGDVDDRVVAAAGRAGYEAAAALPHGRFASHPEPLRWPRLMVERTEGEGAYRRHVSRPMRLLRSSPTWALVSRVAPLVGRLRS